MKDLLVLIFLSFLVLSFALKPGKRPLNIAHRGSSGRLPEHTLEAYRLAIEEGTDYIECDICLTKDLVPVCRHETWLNASTNIWEKSALRAKLNTYTIDNRTITDFFTVDLTLKELQSLRVRQRLNFRDQNLNYMYKIPTLEEHIKLAQSAGRTVGIYPELKVPSWVNSLDIVKNANTTFEDIVVGVLSKYGYKDEDSPCFVQSFSKQCIKDLSTKTKLPLVMLYEDPIQEEEEFKDISNICHGVGVWKNMIIPVSKTKYLEKTTSLVTNAHKYNLKVHAFTFRNEDRYLAWNYTQDPYNEYQTFLDTEIDGFFTDFPGTLKRFLDLKYDESLMPCSGSVHVHESVGLLTMFTMCIFFNHFSFMNGHLHLFQ